MESIQVKHSGKLGREHRERERERESKILQIGERERERERENVDGERENCVVFKSGTIIFGFDRCS